MKKVGVGILIFLVIILLGVIAGRTFMGNVVKDTCEKPYIYVGGNCCLDKDNNNICDNDERATSVIRAVDVKDECVINRRLTCAGKKISPRVIELKLRNDMAGIVSITSIELSNVGKNGCKKTYSGNVEDGFDYQNSKQFLLDCDFTENYVNSLITIKGMVYERSNMKGPAIMPYTIWDFETDCHISGFIE